MAARRTSRRGPGGFTLVEFAVSLAILGFVTFSAAAILFEGISGYHRVVDRKHTLDAVRLAMERIIRDVRQISAENGTPAIRQAAQDTLEFDRVDAGGGAVAITVQPGAGGVDIVVGGTPHALLEAAGAAVSFKYFAYDEDTGALTELTPLPLSQSLREGIERIEVEVQASVGAFDAARSEAPVVLRSSCYIRNLIGEFGD